MLAKTFHTRLVIFSLLPVLLLTGALIYLQQRDRTALLNETFKHQSHGALAFVQTLQKDLADLANYTRLISHDTYLQEYIHLASLNGDTGPLHRLMQQSYGWLPFKTRLVFSHNGHTLVGADQSDLASEIAQRLPSRNQGHQFYLSGDGLTLVAVEPVYYQGKMIGAVALSHPLKNNWAAWRHAGDNQTVFIIQNNQVLFSSRAEFIDAPFNVYQSRVTVKGEKFTLYPVALPYTNASTPYVWLGYSETYLNELTDDTQVLLIIGIATALILIAGLTLSRLFSRPFAMLAKLTQQITLGNLPGLRRTADVQTEADVLRNHIIDMAQVFKAKQQQANGAHQQLQKSAITDTLTGLYNRRHLQDIYPKLLAQARRDRRAITAILCDLDYFKQLNDTYGHLAGDRALEQFANILKSHSRGNDFLYRLGGEEFLILSIGEERDGGNVLAEKIRSAISTHPIVYKRQMIPITVSCGVSCITPDGSPEASLQTLLANTDKALYLAKETGRNRVCNFNEIKTGQATHPSKQKSKSAL